MARPNWNKRAAIAGIVAVLVAVVGLFVSRQGGSNHDDRADEGIACSGSGQAVVNCYQSQAEAAADRREAALLADASRYADQDPQGSGPWPFAVVRDGGIGLKVRTTNVEVAEHIGGLASHQIAWVTCSTRSGFDPDPSTGNGDLWYEIKWPSRAPGSDYRTSGFSDLATGWAYAYYLTPIGHNGHVPAC